MEIKRDIPTVVPISSIQFTPYEANEIRMVLERVKADPCCDGPTLRRIRGTFQQIKGELADARP